MTGIFSPSSGEAWVAGNSILDKIQLVQQHIGYCPQFDVLWEELTVEEHLRFYSRLKNVDGNIIDKLVNKTLENTNLVQSRNFRVKELSGGMKRRLSLGISLVGNPKIVFLDEPTTGLDPDNKRQIWEILSNCKEGKCMILTTHLMDEAEVLADRIGIIVNGQLKCLGTKFKLKRVYGKGFKLVINLNTSSNKNINNEKNSNSSNSNSNYNSGDLVLSALKEVFPSTRISESYKSTCVYVITTEEFDAEILFNKLNEIKENLGINNWAISQVSLEDIFIKLTEKDIYT